MTLRNRDESVEQTALRQAQDIAFAVNLFLPEESAITPRATLPIAGTTSGQGDEITQSLGRREIWRPLALLALALLLIEWLVYRRATLVQLWTQFRGQILEIRY
jgi:hypothetical protein